LRIFSLVRVLPTPEWTEVHDFMNIIHS